MQSSIEVMKPLYPPEGSPVCGYMCCAMKADGRPCRRVVKTKVSIWRHLLMVHGIKKQAKLKFEKDDAEKSEPTGIHV